MPSGADENDSFEKDEELANGIFSKLGAGVRPGACEEKRLPGTPGSQLNLWGSSSLPCGKSQAPISKEAFLKHQRALNTQQASEK